MKVVEKDTDRRAEVHFYAEGNVNALDEYGEYVDPKDNAICAFVPVKADQVIKIAGKFHGITSNIHCDVLVDGICRKSSTFVGKSVTAKSINLGFDHYLFQTEHGLLDSELKVTGIPEFVYEESAPIGVGTIEMRIYVLRRSGDRHNPSDLTKYYECEGEGHDTDRPIGYELIAPDYAVTFNKDRPEVESRLARKVRKIMDGPRPGCEPWAILRFHYRDFSSIRESKTDRTYSATFKKKAAPRILQIPALPPLDIGVKQEGNDDSATRQSSLTPSLRGTPTPRARLSQLEPTTPIRSSTPMMKTSPASVFLQHSADSEVATTENVPAIKESDPIPKATEMAKPSAESNGAEQLAKRQHTPATSTAHEKESNTDIPMFADGTDAKIDHAPKSPQPATDAIDHVEDQAAVAKRSFTSVPSNSTQATECTTGPTHEKTAPPLTPSKRGNEDNASDTPAEKRTKLSASPAPDSPLLSTTTAVKARNNGKLNDKVAKVREDRRRIAEELKKVNDKLAAYEAKMEQLYAKEKEEHDREAEELRARMELLAQFEADGLMDAK